MELPVSPPAEIYGDVFIDRSSIANKVIPIVFSHWVHRVKYTCRVCHYELEFSLSAGETPILCESGTISDRHCTACHNGKISFGPIGEDGEKNCDKCHNADTSPNTEKFFELQGKLPKAKFGNKIDWTKAFNDGRIKPKNSLLENFKPSSLIIKRTLTLRAEMSGISSAVYPHKTHEDWMDCSTCHPDIFNIKKKTTESLSKASMLKGKSCGVCHLRIAFPLNDCKRCHPKMRM
ncbi:MAG: hypothetical protein HY755_10705 [Nitrospirae bacterium]|nr:hypothetical protein [Nitrospirota bacterium]